MGGRAVSMRLPNEAKENYEQESERFFHLTDQCSVGTFAGISLFQLIQENHDGICNQRRTIQLDAKIFLQQCLRRSSKAIPHSFNVCRHGAFFDFKPYKPSLTASIT